MDTQVLLASERKKPRDRSRWGPKQCFYRGENLLDGNLQDRWIRLVDAAVIPDRIRGSQNDIRGGPMRFVRIHVGVRAVAARVSGTVNANGWRPKRNRQMQWTGVSADDTQRVLRDGHQIFHVSAVRDWVSGPA
jgi:hypothetical protein